MSLWRVVRVAPNPRQVVRVNASNPSQRDRWRLRLPRIAREHSLGQFSGCPPRAA